MLVDNYLQTAITYATAIATGEKIAGEYIQLACKRFLQDLQRPDLEYRNKEVNKVLVFLESLYLTKTEQENTILFTAQPFQMFIICSIYGFYYVGTNNRKTKKIYIEIPKKAGKSFLITALAMYHLIFDNEAQVIVSANSLNQARDVDFDFCTKFALQLDPTKKIIKPQHRKIKFRNSEIIVTASDVSKLAGINASVGIIDEYYEAVTNELYNNLATSQATRNNPLMFVITTAGNNVQGVCYQMRDSNIKILQGLIEDDSLFTMIFTIPEKYLKDQSFLENPEVWAAVNPNYGITIKPENFTADINKAKYSAIDRNQILMWNFNIWITSGVEDEKLVNIDEFKACQQDIKISDFQGCYSYVGIDLSQVSDLTVWVQLIVVDDIYYFFTNAYLCEYNDNPEKLRKQLVDWSRENYIRLTDGNTIDYQLLQDDIIDVNTTNPINLIYYDRHQAATTAINLTREGFIIKPIGQNLQSLNAATKELQRLIKRKKAVFENNPLVTWNFGNACVKEYNNCVRPVKPKINTKPSKIDIVVSAVMALAAYMDSNGLGGDIIIV